MNNLKLNNSRVLITQVKDENTGKSGKMVYMHSKHSEIRSQQRGLNNDQISFALKYGSETFKQGLIFFVVRDKDIPDDLKPQKRKKYKNIVLVTSSDGGILTCYKSKNGNKAIKMKRKRLGVYKTVA